MEIPKEIIAVDTDSLAEALEQEHREIDAGIAQFADAQDDPAPLIRAADALRRHIYLEEEFLFPLLRETEPALAAPVFVMLREHGRIWQTLDALERGSRGGAPETGELIKQLTIQLLHHNLKEESVLYPRARALSPAAAEQLGRFLGAGALPTGWVCLKARPAGGEQSTDFPGGLAG